MSATIAVRRGAATLAALGAVACVAAPSAHAIQASTVRASLTPTGAEIQGYSALPVVSADGRWVAFDSYADDVVPGDGNGADDVFLRDMHTGEVRRVSRPPDGSDGGGGGSGAAISADGRYVAFVSAAQDLAPDSTNSFTDILVYDRVEGTLRRVSTNLDGKDGSGASLNPQISSDGSAIVFFSQANDLVEDDSGRDDIFVADTATLTVRRASVNKDGATAD